MKFAEGSHRATSHPAPFIGTILRISLATLALAAPARADVASLNAWIASNNPYLDYVIQDVCVDGSGNPIVGDPATCPSHRNLRIGEKIPYLRTDVDTANGNATYEAVWSFPVPSAGDMTLRIMNAKSNQGEFSSSYVFNFSLSRDGYDLMDTYGPNFSYIRTSDGGCFDQKISQSASERQNGWIAFPETGGSGLSVHGIIITALSPNAPAGCGGAGSGAEDVWNPPVPVTYESLKTLSTIVSYHFAASDLTLKNNALERSFFTREYGFSRWEAWIPTSRCLDPSFAGSPASRGHPEYCSPSAANYPLRGRCSPGIIPATASWGNQSWVRIDCRDSTHYIPLTTPIMPLDRQMGQSDGLVDVDSAPELGAP